MSLAMITRCTDLLNNLNDLELAKVQAKFPEYIDETNDYLL